MNDIECWDSEGRFGFDLTGKQMSRMLQLCQQATSNETGGILVGFYTESLNKAVVQDVFGPPPDSKRGKTWFFRGILGLQQKLNALWRRKVYYLGEWHFHPFGSPVPSEADIRQMRSVATSNDYRCPEPILVIIGGDPRATWSLGAFVFPQGSGPVKLEPGGRPCGTTR